MIQRNKTLLGRILGILIVVYIGILTITYGVFKSYAVEENEAKLQDLLMHNKALHTYVEKQLKPVIYELKTSGAMPQEFFDPRLLSFTYMSRNIMQEYNKERDKRDIEPIRYKLASANPRNEVNRADRKEEEILQKLNQNELSKYHEHIDLGSKEYIFYALPVAKNVDSCMQCHGTPKDAPAALVAMYGDRAGFYEKIGDIRAFISVTMPLTWSSLRCVNSIRFLPDCSLSYSLCLSSSSFIS